MISPAIPGLTLSLEATASGVAIGGLDETDVTFGANGISTGGKSVAGVAGFIAFNANASTAAVVNKEEGTVSWINMTPNSINWDPIDHTQKSAKVDIKDGAILELYLDYEGYGVLDVKQSVLDATCFVPHNDDDDNENGIAGISCTVTFWRSS